MFIVEKDDDLKFLSFTKESTVAITNIEFSKFFSYVEPTH